MVVDWRKVNGWLSTYILGFVVVFEGLLLSNPDLGVRLLEDVGLGAYAPLILSLAAFTYDFLYPRASHPPSSSSSSSSADDDGPDEGA